MKMSFSYMVQIFVFLRVFLIAQSWWISTANLSKAPAPKIIKDNETAHEFMDRLFEGYNRIYRPLNYSNPGAGTMVYVNIYVNSFGYISVRDMEYEVDIMLRQHWNDPRLQFYHKYVDTLVLNEKKKKFWTSDLFFRNAKSSTQHEVTKPNQLIWLSQNGDILHSQKISLTLSCTMNLTNFPLDTQTCYIEIGSFGYSILELNFSWLNESQHNLNVELNPSIKLNEFYTPGVYTTNCAKKYKTTGSFACLKAELTFARKFGFYLIYTYVPSVLVVVISWLSFFVDFTVVPGRVTLCLLSLLSLITQSSATIQSLPRVSYIKAMDVWLFACLAFVVGSLVEFAMVNSLCREKPHKEQTDDDQKQTNSSHKEQENVDDTLIRSKSLVNKKEGHFKKYFDIELGHKIDKSLQVIFPSLFLLFNIVYWTYYWRPHEAHPNFT